MLTDIEIAQAASPLGIQDIAKKAGIPEDLLECYGNDKAKVALRFLNEDAPRGKLV
ncbi:MAG: formate--tetrahydrofolate ligase, partial [Lachnospiraceae bacterium]|nr:formate--tetrahydrofolate ligase [Lachnospiraceae bacterium]